MPNPYRLELQRSGHVLIRAESMQAELQRFGPLPDWDAFAESWTRLPEDGYMADGGRYRRRRHGAFSVAGQEICWLPPQPHFQSRDYNPLNGGVERWFEPLETAIGESRSLQALLRFCAQVFGEASPEVAKWFVEVHQFRIEATEDAAGQPTPEGMHRDGVEWVLVLLINRHNVAEGVTQIQAPDGQPLGEFTLTRSGDCCLVDDTRVFHGVTPVVPIDPEQPSWRNVLVITFRRQIDPD